MINYKQSFNQYLKTSGFWRSYSPTAYQYWKKVIQFQLQKILPTGKILDIGAGQAAYQELLTENHHFFSCDRVRSDGANPVVGDALALPFVADLFDGAVSFQVLEHITDPLCGLKELRRVVKCKGLIVLTVPHLSRLHDIPNDYYRFTKYGLELLLSNAGIEVVSIEPAGGLISFLGHQLCLILAMIFLYTGPFRKTLFILLKYLVVIPIVVLDGLIKTEGLFPHGYVIVAKS